MNARTVNAVDRGDFDYLLELAREARQGIVSALAELRFHLSRYDEPEVIIGQLAGALRRTKPRRVLRLITTEPGSLSGG